MDVVTALEAAVILRAEPTGRAAGDVIGTRASDEEALTTAMCAYAHPMPEVLFDAAAHDP